MSARAPASMLASVGITAFPDSRPLDRAWWARGLTLAERLRPGTRPTAARAPASARDLRRLERWRTSYDLAGTGQFARMLADRDLDEAGLLALLGETAAGIAGRCPPPWWASFAAEVVAAAPDTPPPASGELSWPDGFAAIVAPFVQVAADRLDAGLRRSGSLAGIDVEILRTEFTRWLAQVLVRLAARTLVLELNVARVTDRLTGQTPGERFGSFVQEYRGRDGLTRLLHEYVVLCRLLCQACHNGVETYLELVRRLSEDRERYLIPLLGVADPGPLVAIEAGGDLHRGGRFVAVLRFADGSRVVYKPRPLAVYLHFNEMIEWLDGKVTGLGLGTLRVVDRGRYGWVEFVPRRPCATPEDVARFYRRLGALMALLYVTDGTDMHCENLVAYGDQPMLVDLETLLHPAVPSAGPSRLDPAAACLESSVYRCVILPRLVIGEHGAVDLSGLGGDSGSPRPFDGIAWMAAATDSMRLVRAPAEFGGAQNRPRLADADADPAGYVEVLLAGFRAGYCAIAVHRDELMALVERCAADEVRLVVRPTRLYARILDETTHPDVMRDALDRDQVIDVLWRESVGDGLRERLIRQEAAELWAGDVPYFVGRPGATDVWTSTGRRLENAFAQTSLWRVAGKLDRMGELDRHDQEWIIRAALATREQPRAHHAGTGPKGRPPAVPSDPQRLRAAALGVADLLLARACRDGDRVNWLGVDVLGDRYWTVEPLNAGLANGYCGVALFLAQACSLTGIERYGDCALRAVSRVPELLETLAAHPDQATIVGCGGFEGLGGLAYGLARIASLLGSAEVMRWAGQAVELAAGVVDHDDKHDVLEGLGGGLAAMVAVHRMANLPGAWAAARRCADRLREPAFAGLAPVGFGRGGAGVACALIQFAAAGGGEQYLDLGRAALDRERRRWLPWLDTPGSAQAIRHGWCDGLAGVALAEAACLGIGPDRETTYLDRAIDLLARHPLANHSLCHGELGNLEPLLVAADRHGAAGAVLTDRTSQLLESIEANGPRCATPGEVASPGLLCGLSGIGYGLLRAAFTDRVPSVLLLAAGPSTGR